MENVCATCLNTQRAVVPLKNIFNVSTIWKDVSFQKFDHFCWECVCLFKKVLQFKQQILTAQSVLRSCGYEKIKRRKSLSNLSISSSTNVIDIKENDLIKTETKDDHLEGDSNLFIESDTDLKEESSDIVLEYEELSPKNRDPEVGSDDKDKELGIKEKHGETKLTITTYLFTKNRAKREFSFDLFKREKQFDVVILGEEEMLAMRESDKSNKKFMSYEFKCVKCILRYTTQEQLDRHVKKLHGNRPYCYNCSICDVQTMKYDIHIAHFVRHYVCYRCKQCDYRNQNLRHMLEHDKRHNQIEQSYKCRICSEEFYSHNKLRYHRNKSHKKVPPCELCGRRFVSTSGLKLHMSRHNGLPTYTCDICKKDYKGKAGLRYHMRTHFLCKSDENAYCAECDIQFKDKYRFNQHLRVNSKHRGPGDLKYKCSYCNKQFMHKTSMKVHLQSVHLNKREYACHICNKDYVRRDRLNDHIMYDHEGRPKPRNHVCSYCQKTFTSKNVLINHVRTHTGERPFECELCQARFTQRTALRTHVKGVHRKKQL